MATTTATPMAAAIMTTARRDDVMPGGRPQPVAQGAGRPRFLRAWAARTGSGRLGPARIGRGRLGSGSPRVRARSGRCWRRRAGRGPASAGTGRRALPDRQRPLERGRGISRRPITRHRTARHRTRGRPVPRHRVDPQRVRVRPGTARIDLHRRDLRRLSRPRPGLPLSRLPRPRREPGGPASPRWTSAPAETGARRAAAAAAAGSGWTSSAIVVSSPLPSADAQRSAQPGTCRSNQPWSCSAANRARSRPTPGCHGSAVCELP